MFSVVGPKHSVALFGVKLVGINSENLKKALLTLVFLCLLVAISIGLRHFARYVLRGRRDVRLTFWTRQGIHVLLAVLGLLGMVSVWFDDPTRLTTAFGLVSAGLAFALQKVVTSLAGYFVILRGKTFNVGDRITMGGVRGDVVALGFIQTTIMEMGQPPEVQNADPAMWVKARQYSGRIVTVTNSKIFDEPVYNYSRDFPYIWEEVTIPISFTADRERTEKILLAAAEHHSVRRSQLDAAALEALERRYVMHDMDIKPRVYCRITSNWYELSLRFLVKDHDIREVKDAMAREIMRELDQTGIGIASTTFEIVGLPPLRLVEAPTTRRVG